MKSIEEARNELIERIHLEGATAAFNAALAICQDKTAPAPARATAAATIFRAGGYFDRRDQGDAPREGHEMTPDELAKEIRKIERQAAQKPPSIFE